jgi:hypothetical protein
MYSLMDSPQHDNAASTPICDTTVKLDISDPPISALISSTCPLQDASNHPPRSLDPDGEPKASMLLQSRSDMSLDSLSRLAIGSDNHGKLELYLPSKMDNGKIGIATDPASGTGSAAPTSCTADHHRSTSSDHSVDISYSDERGRELRSSEHLLAFPRDANSLESNTSVSSLEQAEYHESAQDISDTDDMISDVTDYTDLSLIEAFEASPTSFGPMLLLILISLKEEVVNRIRQGIEITLLEAEGTRQRPSQHEASSSHHSEQLLENSSNLSLTQGLVPSRKRGLDDDENDPSWWRKGDDGDQRKRKDSLSRSELENRLRKFACPFYKRYPGSKNLQRSCLGPGWPSVHRVK